jgi:transcriptional regulator with XRE-family HTH domain
MDPRMVTTRALLGEALSPTTRARLLLGLSRQALAERTRLSISTLASLERGARVAPATLAAVATALGVEPRVLLARPTGGPRR